MNVSAELGSVSWSSFFCFSSCFSGRVGAEQRVCLEVCCGSVPSNAIQRSRSQRDASLLSAWMQMRLGRRSLTSGPLVVQAEIALHLLAFKMLSSILYQIYRN